MDPTTLVRDLPALVAIAAKATITLRYISIKSHFTFSVLED